MWSFQAARCIDAQITPFDECLVDKSSYWFEQLLEFRSAIQQDKSVQIRNLLSWNLNSWTPQKFSTDPKGRIIRAALRKGPVCIQETKWQPGFHHMVEHTFAGVSCITSDAIPTENGGWSGDVATLVPCGFQVLDKRPLIESRALAVLVASRTSRVWIINVYLHEAHKERDLEALSNAIPSLGHVTDYILVGDFNRADISNPRAWKQLLSDTGTVDIDPAQKLP